MPLAPISTVISTEHATSKISAPNHPMYVYPNPTASGLTAQRQIKPWKTFHHNPPISRHLASRGADPIGIRRRRSKLGRD